MRRIDTKGRSLREHAARGTMINTAFLTGLSALSLLRGFVLAALLTTSEFGLWGVLAASLGTLLWLKQIGIGDKFVQQDEDDQVAAFQKAFTLDLLVTGIAMVVLFAVLPLLVLLYGEQDLLLPGIAVILLLPAGPLSTPLWIYYRRMDFMRQRLVQSIDPVVGFVVAITLALLGAGYWALVGGMLAGAWATALVSVIVSPYKLALRLDRGTARSYLSFSWPLFISGGSAMIIAQSATITGEAVVGLAGVGAMALTANISQFTARVDGLITGTLYPAICAVRDRTDLLQESFIKSNRLALMWAFPFGVGVTLFCGDLVTYVLGEEWRLAVTLLQVTGVNAAVGHIAFNWEAYMRATNRTRPIAWASAWSMISFVCVGIPLLIAYGLRGLAVGIVVQTVANILARIYFMRQIFTGFNYIRQALRAVLPVVPATLVVLLTRLVESGPRSVTMVIAELTMFLVVTLVATWFFENRLLREALSYLGVRRRAVPAA